MKNLFNKIILAVASVAFLGLLTGCNPEIETKPFSVTFTGFGPGYVSCVATVPSPTQVFYLVSDEPIPYMEPEQLILDGFGAQTTFYTDGEQQLLDFPVEEEQHYYVYLTARLGNKLSKMYEDRLSLTRTIDGWQMEGLRKDALRISSALEHRLTPPEQA